MKNPFTNPEAVPAEFVKLTAETMKENVTIEPSQPAYFAHRLFENPSYDPVTDGVEPVTGTHFVKITEDTDAARKELAFLDQMGLIVTTETGEHFMSPLAAVFYGAAGLFGQDLNLRLSTLATAEDRLEFLRPVYGLLVNYVLPGRIMRARLVRGALPDTVYEGQRLTEELREMQAVLNRIMSML